jgi:hypothetical protein
VLASLLPLLAGRLLVGHGVARDAVALGLVLLNSGGMPAQPAAEQQRGPPAFLQLAAAGACFPAYDTRAFPGFQGRAGSAFTLRRLARDHLGRSIQGPRTDAGSRSSSSSGAGGAAGPSSPVGHVSRHLGGTHNRLQRRGRKAAAPQQARAAPHDAVEDARAAMDLFVRVARPQLLLDAAAAQAAGTGAVIGDAAFDRLVELQTAALLAQMRGVAAAGGESDCDEP